MDITDVVVGRFVVANHPIGSDKLFDEPVLEVGKHYKVLKVDVALKGIHSPCLLR